MRIYLIAIGTKMPTWVQQVYQDYARRLPKQCQLILKQIPAEKRYKNADIQKIKIKENKKLLVAVPKNSLLIALDERGKMWSTQQLAIKLENWMMSGRNIALLMGGPEGLTDECRQKADQLWALSRLTFPHPLVRVIVAEQLFRAWSITSHHPYHRAG